MTGSRLRNDEADLAKKLEAAFGCLAKPTPFHDAIGYHQKQNQVELLKFEYIEWDTANPQELEFFYEAPPFMSSMAYLYLIPKVYSFCIRWRSQASDLNILNTFFRLPLVKPSIIPAASMSAIERKLVWKFLCSGSAILSYYFLFDEKDDLTTLKNLLGLYNMIDFGSLAGDK